MDAGKVLTMEAVMAAARQATGLEDFGDDGFVERGAYWFAAIKEDGSIREAAYEMLAQVVTGWLVNRLRLHSDLERHPEITREVVREPLFVTGVPRTGTTKLQRMLACDPAVQSLPFWLLLNPAPIPGVPTGISDPRVAIAAGYLDLMAKQFPDFLTAHPAFVDEPEEESFLIETDFRSLANCTRVRVPSFWAGMRDDPGRESLPFLHQHLQYFQWQRGKQGRRPWVLKSPLHLGVLESLYRSFPDAILVHTHRDLRVALPSIARITEVWRSMTTDAIDLPALGAEMLATWSWILDNYLKAREGIADALIIDVGYDDICHRPGAVIGGIYERIGRELTPETVAAMWAWEDAHPQHQFGRHAYSLERYGLTVEQVDSAFAAYTDRFGEVLQESQ